MSPLEPVVRAAESVSLRGIPPWRYPEARPEPGSIAPDPKNYMEIERFVAGVLSTMPPFDKYHPFWALPFARAAIDAMGDFEPEDA